MEGDSFISPGPPPPSAYSGTSQVMLDDENNPHAGGTLLNHLPTDPRLVVEELDEPGFPCGEYHSCCHTRTCVRFIGAYEVIILITNIAVIGLFASYVHPRHGQFVLVALIIVSSLITLAVLALLFYGVFAEKSPFLIPYMVMQILAIVLSFGGAILLMIQFESKNITVLSTLIVTMLIRIYLTTQVKKCFDYLREKLEREKANGI